MGERQQGVKISVELYSSKGQSCRHTPLFAALMRRNQQSDGSARYSRPFLYYVPSLYFPCRSRSLSPILQVPFDLLAVSVLLLILDDSPFCSAVRTCFASLFLPLPLSVLCSMFRWITPPVYHFVSCPPLPQRSLVALLLAQQQRR